MRVHTSASGVNLLAEDDFGIVYLIENPQQFWSELDDLLTVPENDTATLSFLDTTLRRFVSLCASYHEQYLQSPLQLEHACQRLLDSELFTFHSERMRELIAEDVQTKTDPYVQLILFSVLLYFGRRQPSSLRSHKRWEPLIPLLMDHILVEFDLESEFLNLAPSSSNSGSYRQSVMLGPVTIEAKLRALGVKLLYEVCRVQKLSEHELRIFSDSFIDSLFELVEQTRFLPDETLNYSVIKLLVALNEQFMVAGLGTTSSGKESGIASSPGKASGVRNRVVDVLISRLGSSKTFGENMIYMLNRASQSAEDLCMQLLVLKLLYILFTSKATSEYFYTNDLCVLVDVFLRELSDLGEENEPLRQTYLRVLHPLLTRTQLRNTPYKRPQIVMTLETMIRETQFRDINPTTKRLVERCLSGDWCVRLRRSPFNKDGISTQDIFRQGSPSNEAVASTVQGVDLSKPPLSATPERSPSLSKRQIKASRSIDNIKAMQTPRLGAEPTRRPSADSAKSFSGVPLTTTAPASRKSLRSGLPDNGSFPSQHHVPSSPSVSSEGGSVPPRSRRPPPPPPKKRGMAPTVVGVTNGGATITAIASSVPVLK